MFYILKNKLPVKVDSILEYASNIESNRSVKHDKYGITNENGDNEIVTVSTIFLGINHSLDRESLPVLFETMIFGGKNNYYQDRYCTWDEAITGHEIACKLVKDEQTR